ncbi:hypothetical protein QR680_010971 [Steinernema hermaphroditum]|uniref:Uncharacterized protein n=1 Tax=Steinernema hermaphroditum TaxID=289476 RepID=A0AA39IQQ2_9BILA|nr:hypothetical protein QR680_010971 [Steinernema hermaphroditum]
MTSNETAANADIYIVIKIKEPSVKTEFTGEMYEQTTSPTAVAVVWSMFGFLSLMAIIYGLRMLWRRRQENRALVAAISAAPPRIHHHHESPEEKTWKGLVDPHTIV